MRLKHFLSATSDVIQQMFQTTSDIPHTFVLPGRGQTALDPSLQWSAEPCGTRVMLVANQEEQQPLTDCARSRMLRDLQGDSTILTLSVGRSVDRNSCNSFGRALPTTQVLRGASRLTATLGQSTNSHLAPHSTWRMYSATPRYDVLVPQTWAAHSY